MPERATTRELGVAARERGPDQRGILGEVSDPDLQRARGRMQPRRVMAFQRRLRLDQQLAGLEVAAGGEAQCASPRTSAYQDESQRGILRGVRTEQIAVRIPAELLSDLDALVATGVYESRAAAVRAGVEAVTALERRRQIDRAIVVGYQRIPSSAVEDAAAVASLRDAIADEPW